MTGIKPRPQRWEARVGMKTNHSSMSIKIVPKGRDHKEDSLVKQKVIICLTVLTMDKFKTKENFKFYCLLQAIIVVKILD